MPWSETSPMDQKRLFIKDYMRGQFAMTELCIRYRISRKTGYKWIARFDDAGSAGLLDRSRRPRSSPSATPGELVGPILDLRRRHPTWGAKKLLSVLEARHPRIAWPARSTVCDILKREGLITHRRRRRYPGHGGKPMTPMNAPNEIWCADFKGEFKTRDGLYCYPLTITDGYSRFLLACQALGSTAHEGVKPVFARVFGEFGLPRIIRTDNGVPFATTALLRLSRLSAWWIRLGIYPELIQPGHPEQKAARAHAPNAEGGDDPSGGGIEERPATTLQHLPQRIQRRSAARSARPATTVVVLRDVIARVSLTPARDRLSGPLRPSLRHAGRCDPLPEAARLGEQGAPRSILGPRRDRRRCVGRLLRCRPAWSLR